MNITRAIFTVFALAVGAVQCLAVDWADFRGPNGNPVHDGNLPRKDEWRHSISYSGCRPSVWGGSVFTFKYF